MLHGGVFGRAPVEFMTWLLSDLAGGELYLRLFLALMANWNWFLTCRWGKEVIFSEVEDVCVCVSMCLPLGAGACMICGTCLQEIFREVNGS